MDFRTIFLWAWGAFFLFWRIWAVPPYTDIDGGPFLLWAYLPNEQMPSIQWGLPFWFPLFFQLARMALRWWAPHFTVLHVLSAFLASLLVPLVYRLARKIVSDQEAFLASLLLGSSLWFMSFNRFYWGYHNLEIFFSSAVLLLSAVAASRRQSAMFQAALMLAGLWLINGVHISIPSFAAWFVFIWWTGSWRWLERKRSWLVLAVSLLVFIAAAAVHAKLLNYTLAQTLYEGYLHHYYNRASRPMTWAHWTAFWPRALLQAAVFAKDLFLVSSGATDSYWARSIGRPLVVWPLPIFLALGLARSAGRRDIMDKLCLSCFAAYTFFFCFLIDYQARRFAPLMPLIFIVIAREMIHWWRLRPRRAPAMAITGVLLAAFSLRDWNDYFYHYERINRQGYLVEKGHIEIAQYIQTHSTPRTLILHGGPWPVFHAYTGCRFLTQLIAFERMTPGLAGDARLWAADVVYLVLPLRQIDEDPPFWKSVLRQTHRIVLTPGAENLLYRIPQPALSGVMSALLSRGTKLHNR